MSEAFLVQRSAQLFRKAVLFDCRLIARVITRAGRCSRFAFCLASRAALACSMVSFLVFFLSLLREVHSIFSTWSLCCARSGVRLGESCAFSAAVEQVQDYSPYHDDSFGYGFTPAARALFGFIDKGLAAFKTLAIFLSTSRISII